MQPFPFLAARLFTANLVSKSMNSSGRPNCKVMCIHKYSVKFKTFCNSKVALLLKLYLFNVLK